MRRQRAFSLIELLVVIGIIGILAGLLLSALASAQHRSRQTTCLNNLHQVGIGFTSFALDHEGAYPMRLASRLEGSFEYRAREVIPNTTFSADYHHFLALSNQVPNVRVMTCPADRRKRAANFAAFDSANLSYWANAEAVPHATLSLLAGDRNLITVTNAGAENPVLQFDNRTHRNKGSVLFADGRVEFTRQLAYTPPAKPEPTGGKIPPKVVAPSSRGIPTQSPTAPKTTIPTKVPPPAENVIPQQGRDSLPSQNTAQNSATNPPPPAGSRSVEWNARKVQSSTATASPEPGATSRRSTVPSGTFGAGHAEKDDPSDDPWDTPRFRIIKMLVAAGYLLALIWAIILLLLCYLRWRIEQRKKARENAATQN